MEKTKKELANADKVELRFNGRSFSVNGTKTRMIEGNIPNFEPSVKKVLLKAMLESESEEDKEHEGKYFNGEEYVDIPKDLSEFEKALLKTRVIKQLFQDTKLNGNVGVTKESGNVLAVLGELYEELSARVKLIETSSATKKPKSNGLSFDDMRLGNMIRTKKKMKDAQHEGRIQARKTEKSKTESEGQMGLTNALSEDTKDKDLSLQDMKLRDFAKKKT